MGEWKAQISVSPTSSAGEFEEFAAAKSGNSETSGSHFGMAFEQLRRLGHAESVEIRYSPP